MKRLLASICVFLLLPIVVAVAGCNNLSEGDGWKEVQSITYTTDEGKTTLTSECSWEPKSYIPIERSEYDNAPEEFKLQGFSEFACFPNSIDRKDFKTYADSFVGNTYYCSSYNGGTCLKITITGYTLNYVKVKFVSDSVLEINFKGEQKRINTLSFNVTYFTN